MKRDLGDCVEDEINVKILEDVQKQLSRKFVQTKDRTVIHFHNWLRCSESLNISECYMVETILVLNILHIFAILVLI